MDLEICIQSDSSPITATSNSDSGSNGSCIIDNNDSILSVTPEVIPVIGPGGTKLWIPNCAVELKPYVGLKFSDLDEGLNFYRKYAIGAGFNTRKSTKRITKDVVTGQNFLCNKAGYKMNKSTSTTHKDGTKKRKRMVTRVGCHARMVVKLCKDNGGFTVSEFIEEHNHNLYTPGCIKFQKEGRNLSSLHKKMIVDNAKLNIGPVTTYRQASQFAGGYENVGASKEDFKNYQRDLKTFAPNSDAQMFVDIYANKKLLWPAYFFEYDVDEEGHLSKAFWADPMNRKNYNLYGDMVSFDTTFSTNRYNMIFGPFTGVDNHKRCITFAVALIAKEDVDSFEWVFRTFMKCMSYNEPTILITDQDPAMPKAIKKVFEKTIHRFCTWHITKKISEKIGRDFPKPTEFLAKVNACIWNIHYEPVEFEIEWKAVMSEFELEEHVWFISIFSFRDMWVPSYFRELPLGGLMRTTSRSESENHFYSRFLNSFISLVDFASRYVTAMDHQRHEQAKLDNDCKYKEVMCRTPMKIEEHGAKVYTTTIFYEFRQEVYIACHLLCLEDFKKDNGLEIYTVKQQNIERSFSVSYNSINNETRCSCKMFEKHGIPCRHMVWVWKNKMLEFIPDSYILNRWTKYASKKPVFDMEGNILGECCTEENKKRKLNQLWSEVYLCLSLAEGNEENLDDFLKNITEIRKGLETKNSANSNTNTTSKEQEIERLLGVSKPDQILVKEPIVAKNKGSGTQYTNKEKRLRSNREVSNEIAQKIPRLCAFCKEKGHHDKRTCPKRKK